MRNSLNVWGLPKPKRKMAPVRKGMTALFISKIKTKTCHSFPVSNTSASVFFTVKQVWRFKRFVKGSSQQGTWLEETSFTEHITGVIPATNYPHQWPMLGDCGFKAAPSAGAGDVYGREIFKAPWALREKKNKPSGNHCYWMRRK